MRDIVGSDIVGDDPDDLLRAIVSGIDDIEGEVGYDGRDIVGAIARAAASKLKRGPAQSGSAGKRPTMYNGKALDPAKWRRLPAAMPSTSIAAGATADITIKPQRLFRAEFLIATESTASKLFIDGAFVQGENQFVTSGSIPVATFGP